MNGLEKEEIKKIISRVKAGLKANIDLKYKPVAENFFREPITLHGVRYAYVRKIARENFEEIKHLSKDEILQICEQLASSGIHEEVVVAFEWARKMLPKCNEKDFSRFEKWLHKYVSNWAMCDDFSARIINYYVLNYPAVIPTIRSWTKSGNRWLRRASAVSFLSNPGGAGPIKTYLQDIFYICNQLLSDKDDMVQKGYGWLLKAASKTHQKEVFEYVMRNKDKMPRTALRYSIEKMPANLKKLAMSKDRNVNYRK